MKNMSEKTKNILKCTIIGILLIVLVYMVVTLTGKFTNVSEAVATVNPVEFKQEEKNIEELNTLEEEFLEEKINDNKAKKSNTNNQKKKVNSDKQYYIKVNYGANVVTVYSKDENGEYTVPVKAMVCSTGRATPTSGTYTIKGRWRWLRMLGGVYGQYTTQVVGNILFHSVPYLKKGDSSSLEYWEYDKLGTRASAGCIRLTMQDAIWIYNNIESGTLVEFYSSSDPGPLGKPSAPKISWNEECRGWDPTDPDPNNPWRKYQKEDQAAVEEVKGETIENDRNANNIDNNHDNEIDNNVNNTNNEVNNSIDNSNDDENADNSSNKEQDNIVEKDKNDNIIDDNSKDEEILEDNKNNINDNEDGKDEIDDKNTNEQASNINVNNVDENN